MSWEYICVFHSYLERMKMLNNEQFGELIRALLIYSETGKPPEEMSPLVQFGFDMLKPDVDAGKEKAQKNTEARRKGAYAANQKMYGTQSDAERRSAGYTNTNTNTKTKTNTNTNTNSSIDQNQKETAPGKPASSDPEEHVNHYADPNVWMETLRKAGIPIVDHKAPKRHQPYFPPTPISTKH